MRKGYALYPACTVVSAVESAAPDQSDLGMLTRQSRTSHGRAYRWKLRALSRPRADRRPGCAAACRIRMRRLNPVANVRTCRGQGPAPRARQTLTMPRRQSATSNSASRGRGLTGNPVTGQSPCRPAGPSSGRGLARRPETPRAGLPPPRKPSGLPDAAERGTAGPAKTISGTTRSR